MDLKAKSLEVILKNQQACGSYVASPAFSTYNYCWLRDGSFIAYSMDLSGYHDSAEKFFHWADAVISRKSDMVEKIIKAKKNHELILNSDYLPTRYNLDGSDTKDDWPNFQLDGYGTWLWALCRHVDITGDVHLIDQYKKSIMIIIEYLTNFWDMPNFDCWEENGDKVHPSTLACIFGGLNSISHYVKESNTISTVNSIRNYVFENCIIDGRLAKYAGSSSIDSSLLWAALPFGLYDVNDEITIKTVAEIERKLLHNGGVHRYPEDTYYGGGEWVLLTCWLGWYYVETGRKQNAGELLQWVERHANEDGELPEQVLDHVNKPEYIEKWKELWGEPALPLLWSHAMYLILLYKTM